MRRARVSVLPLALLLVTTTACGARFDRVGAASAGSAVGNGGVAVDQGGVPVDAGGVPVDAGGAPGGSTGGGTSTGGAPVSGSTSGGSTGGGAGSGTPGRVASGSTGGGTTSPGRGTSTGGKTGGGSGGGGSSTGAAPGAVPRGSTDGITDTTIKLGYFVPKTGAAPVPATIDAQAQNYFDYVKTKVGGIAGRNVTVKIYDTQSTEAGARQAVQTAVNDGIFAAVSLDRIAVEGALVTALHKAGIPHLINQMPAAQQIPDDGFYIGTNQVNNGKQIANYMAHTLKVKKVGFVGENDPTAYPARDAFVAEAKRLGLDVVHNEVVDGQGSQFLSEAQKLANDKAESVWLYVAPSNAINISNEAKSDGYHPTWVSSSVAWGFNLVLTPAAGALDGAKAFSPWGGLDDARYATFNQINTEGKTTQDKDIGLASWGYGQIIAAALKTVGKDLGRNSFRAALQNLTTGATDVVTGAAMCWSPLDFTGGKRYGSGDRTIVMTVKGSGTGSTWSTESDYKAVY